MKKNQVVLITAFLALFVFTGCNAQKNIPVFSSVVYEGDDDIYNENPLDSNEFYNPILQGMYPDPAIARKGDD